MTSTTTFDEKPSLRAVNETQIVGARISEEDATFLEDFSSMEQITTWRKVDLMLMPSLSILYLLSHIDRANIGNAKIEGLEETLGMKGTDYNVALCVFFVPYILAEIPSNYILYHIKNPSRYLAFLVTAWGVATTCQGLVHNLSGLVACRFFLGLLEAGFFPGIMHYISLWYPPNKTQSRTAVFYSMAGVAGAFSGLLAAAIAKMNGLGGYEGWRWIFIIEGVASVFFGIVGFFALPDTPELSTKRLDARQIRFLELTHVITRGQPTADGAELTARDKLSTLWSVLKDFQAYLHALSMMASVVPAYGLKFTLPQIMKNMGFTSQKAQLLSAPPYLVGAASALIGGWLGDRLKWRMPVIAISQALLIISCSIQLVYAVNIQNHVALSFSAVFLASIGTSNIPPGVNAWSLNNLAGPLKRSMGVAFMLTMCNIGGIVGSFIFIGSEAPGYPTGFGSCLAFSAAGLFATLTLFFCYRYMNAKKAETSEDEIRERYTAEELDRLGDRSPLFRYGL